MKAKKANKKLVVVADDFGWTEAINQGILRTYKEGIVTEISFMLKAPAVDHAAELIKKHKLKNVGIHMTLTDRKNYGKQFGRKDYIKFFKNKSYKEVRDIALNEIEMFYKVVGKKPTHITTQYGIHGNLKLLESLLEYAKQNGIPARIPRENIQGAFNQNYAAEIMLRRSGVKSTDHGFVHVVGTDLIKIEQDFLEDLRTVKKGESAEMITHPGYFDESILKLSSLNYGRARDLVMCIDPDFRKQIEELGFKIVGYSDLP